MKRPIIRWIPFLALVLLCVPATAQTARLDLRFDHLESKAEETVDINLEGPMLRLAAKFLSAEDPDEKAVRELVSGLTGIYVRSYTFAETGAYSDADVERVRKQLGPSWQRIVTVRSTKKENVDVYAVPSEPSLRGLVVIAAEPNEFTVVQLVGTIDLDRLSSLEGNFGVPDLGLKEGGK